MTVDELKRELEGYREVENPNLELEDLKQRVYENERSLIKLNHKIKRSTIFRYGMGLTFASVLAAGAIYPTLNYLSTRCEDYPSSEIRHYCEDDNKLITLRRRGDSESMKEIEEILDERNMNRPNNLGEYLTDSDRVVVYSIQGIIGFGSASLISLLSTPLLLARNKFKERKEIKNIDY